jgi:ppGpp synthetase/RelA/SpoT-type nucleotidyltranferase
MNYDEFTRDGRQRYQLFAKTVAGILQSAIDAGPQEFRLQQITYRAKDPISMKRKLAERDLSECDSIERELKDLAGCRLIFYTNTDVDRFLNSRLIFENFVVDFDGSKFHHAVGTERSAEQLYFAIHYLVSLKEARLSLPEYARFRGMRCEVQLQTILNHSWAETSHDILYHSALMQGFGTKQFTDIKKRLEKIMNQHLLPAGYEFQKVQHDYERLLAGKDLFDRGTLEALNAAKDNNERYEQLQRIRKDLLPLYDDVTSMAPEVIRIAAGALKAARNTATIPLETPFGNFEGHTTNDVANEALQLVDDLRYVDIELTFRMLCDLYLTAASEEERQRILKSVEALARNDLRAWQQVGFGIQQVLYDAICNLPETEKVGLHPAIVDMCGLFLSTDLQGTTWHFDSVSLHRGAVVASSQYGELRRGVLTLLFDLYQTASSLVERMEVIQALGTAIRFPMDGGRDDLIELVLDNTRQVIEFFTDRIGNEPFEITQHLEHEFLWLYRHSKEMAAGRAEDEIGSRAQAVVGAIKSFRDRANGNDRFIKFKTLVGFESVFPLEWDDDSIGRAQKYRAEKIAEYARSVTPENADEWYRIIQLCAAVKSEDLATFPSFGEFLKQLSGRSPRIVFEYIKNNEEVLGNFLPSILTGFAESQEPGIAVSLMADWINQGRHLHAIAHYLRFAENTPEELVAKVGRQAIKLKDTTAAIGVIVAIIARQLNSLVETSFLPGIKMLTELNDTRWVNGAWYLPALMSFLESLSEQQCEVVFASLVLRQRLDVHDERALRGMAAKYPHLVLQFFKARIDHKEKEGAEKHYEPIPYQMYELHKSLTQHARLIVETIRAWYSPDEDLFTYSGGRLLHNIFPQFTEEYEAELLALVRSGAEDDIDFVLRVLRSYNGGLFLHKICRALIEVLPEGDERTDEIEVILDSTGVVSGEFGMVRAYQCKKEEMQSWLSDGHPKVRAFGEAHLRSLDRAIAAEQRRSEANYEFRRRSWPEEADEKKT